MNSLKQNLFVKRNRSGPLKDRKYSKNKAATPPTRVAVSRGVDYNGTGRDWITGEYYPDQDLKFCQPEKAQVKAEVIEPSEYEKKVRLSNSLLVECVDFCTGEKFWGIPAPKPEPIVKQPVKSQRIHVLEEYHVSMDGGFYAPLSDVHEKVYDGPAWVGVQTRVRTKAYNCKKNFSALRWQQKCLEKKLWQLKCKLARALGTPVQHVAEHFGRKWLPDNFLALERVLDVQGLLGVVSADRFLYWVHQLKMFWACPKKGYILHWFEGYSSLIPDKAQQGIEVLYNNIAICHLGEGEAPPDLKRMDVTTQQLEEETYEVFDNKGGTSFASLPYTQFTYLANDSDDEEFLSGPPVERDSLVGNLVDALRDSLIRDEVDFPVGEPILRMTAFETVRDFQKEYDATLSGPLCWKGLFPAWDDLGYMMLFNLSSLIGARAFIPHDDWDHIEFSRHGDKYHVANATMGRVNEAQWDMKTLNEHIFDICFKDPSQLCKFVELTTLVVAGTIGDVKPSLDVVATNYFAASMDKIEPVDEDFDGEFSFLETGAGWTATDFFKVNDNFAKRFSEQYGSAKGELKVSPVLWNSICSEWGGELLPVPLHMPGSFVREHCDESEYLNVPNRIIGEHKRVMPDDFVLITHPDHMARFADEGWDMRPLAKTSHEFIALGQSILEKGIFGGKDLKAMHEALYENVKASIDVCQQSDLIYLVSGTCFYYFMASIFPEKQVYEICPVPREDNGVCPEFYLHHYFDNPFATPSIGFSLSRIYAQYLTAPKFLQGIEWEGTYKYTEPPKFHSISPWAADKWQISSPNVGFEPYSDFVRKEDFIENESKYTEPIHAYFSLGSCESITRETQELIDWLKGLNVIWEVDERWTYLFEGTTFSTRPYIAHTTYLHHFDWVVHHGGSGITNTCLAIGVPQTILPQVGDQFVWRDALEQFTIKPLVTEDILRSRLFKTRLPAKEATTWCEEILTSTDDWLEALIDNNATPIEPFHLTLHCCIDWNSYGWGPPPNYIVGQNKDYWFGIFNSGWESKLQPNKHELKFIRKICSARGDPVYGWSGFSLTQTYPEHAHGWAYSKGRHNDGAHMKSFNALYLDNNSEETLKAYSNKALTSRSKFNPYIYMKPRNITCRCGVKGYNMSGRCERCLLSQLDNGRLKVEDVETLVNTVYKGFKPRLKPVSKMKTFQKEPSAFWVQSRKRYYCIDSRFIKNGAHRQVGRGLLDRITSLDDVSACEAFWKYTNSKPPHYKYKTLEIHLDIRIRREEARYLDVGVKEIGNSVVKALGDVLSINTLWAKATRVLNFNLMTPAGWSLTWKKWHVLIDAVRHYEDFLRRLDMSAIPDFALNTFPAIENADIKVLLPYSFALAKPIKTKVAGYMWLNNLPKGSSGLRIHLYSLKLPILGSAFGLFHAVMEYDGWFWELQQIKGEKCFINRTLYPPECTKQRPLVKTIIVNSPITGQLDKRALSRDFDGLGYKVLADNCLVFVNLLVYMLTGTVVPWRHFGAFGADVPKSITSAFGQWASSWIYLSEDEERYQVKDTKDAGLTYDGNIVHSIKSWTGPKTVIKDYGLSTVQRLEAALEAYSDDPDVHLPQEKEHMMDFIRFAVIRFGINGSIVARSILVRRNRKIKTSQRKWKFLHHMLSLMRSAGRTRIGQDLIGVATSTVNLRGALRDGKKVCWTPLVNISVPRHWFRSGNRLVEANHMPENLTMQKKYKVNLDLPQIAKKYEHYFPGVEFPKIGFKWIKPGEYEIGVKVNIRKDLPKMDSLTQSLCQELQEMHPFELGVFSLRFGTVEMAQKVTDRYFEGSFEAGQLISEEDQEAIAEAIFQNEEHLFADMQLISPEEVWKKWHRNYSAGFPFRFNENGRAQRQALVDAVGGKAKFLQCVRDYIESPEAFPTVSHAFIKDEVLPASYIEREKIRTIIAQDPLNYFLAMAVQGDGAKRLDPSSFSAVGISPSHGQMSALAAKHLAYEHHTAMDVTAMDSTAAIDAVGVIKKLNKKGYKNHPQRAEIETAVDATYDNLIASWIIDIHTGRARLKKQGLSTGHATTTPSNTQYMRVLMLHAWKEITGRPYAEFYDTVKFSSFSDDNFWSTNLPPNVFSGKLVSDFWLSKGVQVRVEGCSDNLADLSFLSKKFSLDEKHLQEVKDITGAQPKVAIVHDIERLLQKFSDYKKKNTLRYRFEKFAALQLNCAHYPEVHAKVDVYLDEIQKLLLKRRSGKKFLRQHPRMSYPDVMRMMYLPDNKTRRDLIVTTHEPGFVEKLEDWWDTTRTHILAFDSTANTYGRILSQFAGLLEVGGLGIEDPGLWMTGPGELYHDTEFTLEHHLYLLNGCPESFEKLQMLASKTPFSIFMDIPGFWQRRDYYDTSLETANELRVKVTLLMGIYTLVAWLEQALMTVPVVGPLYRFLGTAKILSERVYSKLNSLYYAMFGDSSAVISAMMPKDKFMTLKVIAHRLWCTITPLEFANFNGGIDGAQDWADSIIKLSQDIHQIFLEGDISSLLPVPGTGEANKPGTNTNWAGLDHGDAVMQVLSVFERNATPLITSPPGAGKSTDFILSLKKEFETVIVACPRVILVQNNPVAQTRLYAGCEDDMTRGMINFGTAGYLRRILADLPPSTVICLDEFHEMDEDTLWLLDRYRGQALTITATPAFTGADRFVEVRLSKGRNSRWTVHDEIRKGVPKLTDAWDELMLYHESNERVLVILPTVNDVETCVRHAQQLAKGKRIRKLYRGTNTVVEADWYFATSIVDAGITIPHVGVVIDMGYSLGYSKGKFTKRPSSKNISVQRKGRTGRTCNGTYIRLTDRYDDTNFDFSTPFLCNSWDTASKWDPTFHRGLCRTNGLIEGIPGGYDKMMLEGDWSPALYAMFMYETRLDINKARARYQDLRKFPERKEFQHLAPHIKNQALDDLFVVEDKLRRHKLPQGNGNFYNWNLSQVVQIDFGTDVPSHLVDGWED
ncbi:unnamed protein product [Sclerotinia sclerotiorum hypovirus 1]|uniref:Polyprotein n=1 Tax=Sclerotinia sclerotiorum hypovirus 1 TaxID=1074325 RepID=G1CCU5_9VIRU|nr:unnamed protein product [Sclerotinia sclerotiorum hypovirus 1]AEL99352.1 polyprotein [Sclerotinia sclerotiorum hypovirus 1]